MSAQIIDGRAIAAQVYSELTTRVAVLKAKGVIPRVAIIHVGTEEMTKRYVTLKENAAIRLGMECVTYHLVEDVSQQRVIELVQKLNADESVHGILVQMPLPDSMDTKTVLDAIDPEKPGPTVHWCVPAPRRPPWSWPCGWHREKFPQAQSPLPGTHSTAPKRWTS